MYFVEFICQLVFYNILDSQSKNSNAKCNNDNLFPVSSFIVVNFRTSAVVELGFCGSV